MSPPTTGAVSGILHGLGGQRDHPAIRHRIPGVDHQIHRDLFHLDGVETHRRKVGAGLHPQRVVLADEPLQDPSHTRHRRIDVENGRLRQLDTTETQELSGQGRSVGRGVPDLPQRVRMWVIRPQGLQQEIAVPEDHPEQVVEVVSDPAREPADRLHLLGLRELLFQEVPLGLIHDHGVYVQRLP